MAVCTIVLFWKVMAARNIVIQAPAYFDDNPKRNTSSRHKHRVLVCGWLSVNTPTSSLSRTTASTWERSCDQSKVYHKKAEHSISLKKKQKKKQKKNEKKKNNNNNGSNNKTTTTTTRTRKQTSSKSCPAIVLLKMESEAVHFHFWKVPWRQTST